MTTTPTPLERERAWKSFLQNRDEKSRAILLESYFYLCRITADKFAWMRKTTTTDIADIALEGFVGLCAAVDSYDPKSRAVFTTWAIRKIRCAILEYFRTSDWIPRSLKEKLKLVTEFEDYFQKWELRLPTDCEVSERFNLTSVQLAEIRAAKPDNNIITSLDGFYVNSDGVAESLIGRLAADVPEMFTISEATLRNSVIFDCMEDLPERLSFLLAQRYWFDAKIKDIAVMLAISEPRATQLHKEALDHVKKSLKEKLEGYYDHADL